LQEHNFNVNRYRSLMKAKQNEQNSGDIIEKQDVQEINDVQ
jgi:hypothetical protein